MHIRDMHRLLSYKGYRFKAFDAARAMANINPNENLKSPEELEEEDRAAKQAVGGFWECADDRNCKSSFVGRHRVTSPQLRSS